MKKKKMEPYKLAQISLKLGRINPNKGPRFFYDLIMKSNIYERFKDMASAEDIVYFSFMASAVSLGLKPEELGNLYENLKANVFTFSIGEIFEIEPYVNCDECYGDGDIPCDECDGTGDVRCDDCGGEGEDYEGYTCQKCDGDGDMECTECGGRGRVRCETCDGIGEVMSENEVEIGIDEFVSYDSEIFNVLELKEDKYKLNSDFVSKISNSELTFTYNAESRNVEIFDDSGDRGDFYLGGFNSTPKFYKIGNNNIDDNGLINWD